MILFRALKDNEIQENEKDTIKELFAKREPKYYFNTMYTHLTKGNFITNEYWTSFTKSYNVAYEFCNPVVYRVGGNDSTFRRKIKIRKSNIAISVFDKNIMADITDRDSTIVKLFCKGKAYSYGKSNKEVLALGKVEYKFILTRFQADLIFVLNNPTWDKVLEIEHLEKYINIIVTRYDEIKEIQLTIVEKIIFCLMYENNFNLYEIIAPLFEKNNIDLLSLYEIVFNEICNIILKALEIIDKEICISRKRILDLLCYRMYESELNLVAAKYDEYNENYCDFMCLFDLYKQQLDEININNINSEKLKVYLGEKGNFLKTNSYTIVPKERPLFLYLPKGGKHLSRNLFEFKEGRDFRFYPLITNCCTGKFECIPYGIQYGKRQFKISISKFVSQIYIPESYKFVDEDIFDVKSNRHCGNYQGFVEDKYSDLLVDIFGGNNLKLNDKNDYFKNREFISKFR